MLQFKKCVLNIGNCQGDPLKSYLTHCKGPYSIAIDRFSRLRQPSDQYIEPIPENIDTAATRFKFC